MVISLFNQHHSKSFKICVHQYSENEFRNTMVANEKVDKKNSLMKKSKMTMVQIAVMNKSKTLSPCDTE